MINYTAEAFGTALLILFGDGVVAKCCSHDRKARAVDGS